MALLVVVECLGVYFPQVHGLYQPELGYAIFYTVHGFAIFEGLIFSTFQDFLIQGPGIDPPVLLKGLPYSKETKNDESITLKEFSCLVSSVQHPHLRQRLRITVEL